MGFINKIREYQNNPNENFSSGVCMFLLFLLIIIGYYIFFISFADLKYTYSDPSISTPVPVLNYIRFPVMFIYILLFSFTVLFLFRRLSEKNPILDITFELTTTSFSFGKLLLLMGSIFLAFYIGYTAILSLLIASVKLSLVLTIIILIIVLAIINSYTKMYDTDIPNPIIDFIKDLIFYIPCLVSDFIDYAKKDFNNTPSTVVILLVILVLVCFIYAMPFLNYNDPLLFIDKPRYLNQFILSYDREKIVDLIIQSRPWYERELLKVQSISLVTKSTVDSSFNPYEDMYKYFDNVADTLGIKNDINNFSHSLGINRENFTSIISQELMPVHLNITEYDKYILKQAMYSNDYVREQLKDSSNNDMSLINKIIKQQKKIMGFYEWMLLYLAYLNSSDLSKSIIGDVYSNRYHYGISFWLYLNTSFQMKGKNIIFKYGSKPSMYYDHTTKELTVETESKEKGTVVLYKSANILYQKWNHIVMNYNHGTFDLFINNDLVGTYPNIVNYTTNEELFQVGFITNNNLGGISQMKYSEEPFQLHNIETLYKNQPKF